MILTDGIHLVSTVNEEELHKFAQKMGLKRDWYQCHSQNPKRKRPHYDLTTKKALNRAINAGAQLVSGIFLLKNAWWSNVSELA